MSVIKCDQIYLDDKVVNGYITIDKGRIESITTKYEGDITFDYTGRRIIPGLIDTHNHGIMGYQMRTANNYEMDDEVSIQGYLKGLASFGVTGVFPTCSIDKIKSIAKQAQSKTIIGAKILGIHSEGPWLNRVGEKGIKKEFIEPTKEIAQQMVDDGAGYLKLVSVSPEIKGIEKITEVMKENDVTLAIAHTDFFYNDVINSIENKGFSVMTHLGNAMTGLHHRNVGAIGAGLLNENVYCEIICDFIHVCQEMVQVMLKVKNLNKVIMISDNSEYTAIPPHLYKGTDDKTTIEVGKDGSIHTETGKIQGSSIPMIYGIKNLVTKLNYDLSDVIKLSSKNACDVYCLKDRGVIKQGYYADFVVIDDNYQVEATYVEGIMVYEGNTKKEDLMNQDFLEKHRISAELNL